MVFIFNTISKTNKINIFAMLLLITITFVGINYYEDKLGKAEKEIENLNESEKFKDKEILELKSEIETKTEKLKLNEKSKEKLKEDLNKAKEKINEKDNRIENLDDKVEKLKKELNKYDSLRKLNVVATAYDAFCDTCGQWGGITATGYDISNTVYKNGYRVIAVDPRVIPLNSLVYVESKKKSFVGIAIDTGGAIKGNRIDILMNSRSEAYAYGVQDAKVTILRKGG